MGNQGFHAVPEGFPQADGKALHRALPNSTQGITLGLGGLEGIGPCSGIGQTSHLYELRVEFGKIEHLLGDDARCHYASHADHRMVMALKVASLGASSPVIIDDVTCVAKSFPHFNELFEKL